MFSVDGARDWVLVNAGTLLLLVSPIAARAYWLNRHDERQLIEFFGNFFYTKNVYQRAHVRTGIPFIVLFVVPFFALMLLLGIFDRDFWNREILSGNVAGLTALVLLAMFTASASLYWSILLYNRPKILVPPDLRSELGILEEKGRRSGAKG
jgi:hypothetical protein